MFFFLGMVFLREALSDLRKAWSGLRLQLGSLFFVEMQRFSPETNSSHQKIDGGKTVVSFWGPGTYFQGAFAVRFGDRTCCLFDVLCVGAWIFAQPFF